MKLAIGLVLAVCVGIGCRWFGIPLPGPPAITGAAMAVAMATGYTLTDYWLTKPPAPPTQATHEVREHERVDPPAEVAQVGSVSGGDHYHEL
jgi:XapX domain-containing protein